MQTLLENTKIRAACCNWRPKDRWEGSLLHKAVHSHNNVVEILLQHKDYQEACTNEGFKNWAGNTALSEAAHWKGVDTVKILLRHQYYRQACINRGLKNEKGNTALHIAAVWGRVNVVAAMLKYPDIASAMLSAENNKGQTPAMLAEENDYPELANQLREAEAQLNTTESAGSTSMLFRR
ncbi:MAG: hypothetical protein DHS20C10_00760 [marine bacterium B5-7]|nr:MAG: hypothetical protein DHS20C10_00760 [marine bacterium B5-7]